MSPLYVPQPPGQDRRCPGAPPPLVVLPRLRRRPQRERPREGLGQGRGRVPGRPGARGNSAGGDVEDVASRVPDAQRGNTVSKLGENFWLSKDKLRNEITHGRRLFFQRGGECLNNCNTPKNGFRGGDTFWPSRGGVEGGERGGTNQIFVGENKYFFKNMRRKSKDFLTKKGYLFS